MELNIDSRAAFRNSGEGGLNIEGDYRTFFHTSQLAFTMFSLLKKTGPKTVSGTSKVTTSSKIVKKPKTQSKKSRTTAVVSPRKATATQRSRSKSSSTSATASYRYDDGDDEDEDDLKDDWQANLSKLSSATPVPETSFESRNVYIYQGAKISNIEMGRPLMSAKEFIDLHSAHYDFNFGTSDSTKYTLELPFGSEEYCLATPISDDLDPYLETQHMMELVSQSFVPSEYSIQIKEPSMKDCILRRLRRAYKANDMGAYLKVIEQFNGLVIKLREDGVISQCLEKLDHIPQAFVTEILNQIYSRIVSPQGHALRDYEAFSSNVYGELLPKFVHQLFIDTTLKSQDVFVDLGSGVGNCVLQASLEIGCESWGCEMMSTAGQLAEKQKQGFESRCKLWGVKYGSVHLRNTDFVEDKDIKTALAKADVILVNNYAFSSELNDSLVNMFLDLKNGCRIVSLKSFVPPGHVISEHNIENPVNILRVEQKEFGSNCVSWTDAPGVYFVSTVDRNRLTMNAS